MVLKVKVVPGASRDRIIGWWGDRLKVTVSAPPERGKANAAVLNLLAAAFGLPRSRIRIVAGETSPLKTLAVEVGDPAAALRSLPPR